ncbi:hypothetical protein [Lysinibacillus xylanilyticus]|nr:hypothetical protein [Lysinibacillus xylanilyticus]
MKTTNKAWLSMTDGEKREALTQQAKYGGGCPNNETNKNNAK